MKAFISYSHKDEVMLERLHAHLAQLKREGQISAWTDEAISAGEELAQTISRNLEASQLFIALLSPDYIASNYCYNKEFKRALELHENGSLIVIPVILEPCDWVNTPFSKFKALPKDGKAISIWQNVNTAFLDVIQDVRKLLASKSEIENTDGNIGGSNIYNISGRNYRVKKDFDSIQKLEFVEQTFSEIRKVLGDYIKELLQVDSQIKCRITYDNEYVFEAILVNRNKINSESTLIVSFPSKRRNGFPVQEVDKSIGYNIKLDRNDRGKDYELAFDEFHLYWLESNHLYSRAPKELIPREIIDSIWSEWLESVGIM